MSMSIGTHDRCQYLLSKSQYAVLNEQQGFLKDFLCLRLLAEGGTHVKIVSVVLDIVANSPTQNAMIMRRRDQFVVKLLQNFTPNVMKTLEKVLEISRWGFLEQLLACNDSSMKYRTSQECSEIVQNCHSRFLSNLKNENEPRTDDRSLLSTLLSEQKVYEDLLNSSNYFIFLKRWPGFLELVSHDQKWDAEAYDYFFYLLSERHQFTFDDSERCEISKIIAFLHSIECRHIFKFQNQADMLEFLKLLSELKKIAGEEILMFFILSCQRNAILCFGDVLRGLNLILLQINSNGFFVKIVKWMEEKCSLTELLRYLEESLTEPEEDDFQLRDHFTDYLEKFTKDPSVQMPLGDEEIRVILDQYQIVEELCKKYRHLYFHQLISIAHDIRKVVKNRPIETFDRLRLVAVARLALRFELGIYPYSTQIFALLALILNGKNRQAQIKTGEGKSVVVTLWAFVMAMECRAVDIITSARYLSVRDHDKFATFFQRCGISTGHICYDHKSPKYFTPQILYGPAFDFEFAWMEDLLYGKKLYQERLKSPYLSRNFDAVCVDESDNLLIDASLNGAMLSFPAEKSSQWIYTPVLSFVRTNKQLLQDQPEMAVSKFRSYLSAQESLGDLFASCSLSDAKLMEWLRSAYIALFIYSEKKEYIVFFNKRTKVKSIKIVDIQTGRISNNSRWSQGLHEFLELKHDIPLSGESISAIMLPHSVFYKFYRTLSALTGTKEQFQTQEIYQMDSFDVPLHFPSQRKDLSPVILENQQALVNFIIKSTRLKMTEGRPTLILCQTIHDTENLANRMELENIPFQLLNEIQEEDETSLLLQAGEPAKVTIATNNAGRGTDIILSPQSISNGGLHVLLTFYPNSERVQHQAVGRAGRQGQPGSSQMVLHKEDPRIIRLLQRHSGIISDDEILRVLHQERNEEEKLSIDLHLMCADIEHFLANKSYLFFSLLHEWSSELDQDSVLEFFAQKLKSFNTKFDRDITFEHLFGIELIIAKEYKRLLTSKVDPICWKVFLRQVVERLKAKTINFWATSFFEPSKNLLNSVLIKADYPLKKLEDLLNAHKYAKSSFLKDLEKIKLEVDSEFDRFYPKWQEYFSRDCSGLFVYLNEITGIDLVPGLLDLDQM